MNDAYVHLPGKDMKNGKKTSRAKAAAWLAVGFLPIGKVAKLGKMSAKDFNAVSKGSKAAKSIKKSRPKSSSTLKIKAKKNSEAKAKAAAKARAKAKKNSEAKVKNNTGKKASGADVPKTNVGVVQSRVNLSEKPTSFSPSKNAGMKHVRDRHYNPSKNAGQFTILESDLKKILQSKQVVNTPVKQIESGGFERVIDIGKKKDTVKPSLGGQKTTWIKVITDKAGNIITTYPVPKP